MAISRPRELPAIADGQSLERGSVIVTDAEHRLLYTGGAPLLVFDSDTDAWKTQFFLGGAVRSGLVTRRYVFLVVAVAHADGADLSLAVLSRGLEPKLVQATPVAGQRAGGGAAARHLRPMSGAAAPGAVFVGTHRVGDDILSFTAQGPSALLLRLSAQGRVLAQQPVTLRELRIDDVRGSALGAYGNGSAVFVAGAFQGRWQVTALPLPLGGPAAPLHDRIPVPICTAADPCYAVGGMAVAEGVAWLALEQDQDLALARVDLRTLSVLKSARLWGLGQVRARLF